MKKIILLLVVFAFSFPSNAQKQINWLSDSEFEKAINKEKLHYFIFIEGDLSNSELTEKEIKKIRSKMTSFLKNNDLINYLNNNYACYRFSSFDKKVNFNGKNYGPNGQNGNHEFVDYLCGDSKYVLPSIILRDNKFNLMEYKYDNESSRKRKSVINLNPNIEIKKLVINMSYFLEGIYKKSDLKSFLIRK
jgi:hypothetical protein